MRHIPRIPRIPRIPVGRRRGIATLELVFIFPLLMLMASAIFMMFRGDVGKESAATRARAQVFRQQNAADAGRVLQIDRNPLDSSTSTIQRQPVPLGPLFGRASTDAVSSASVTGRVWDYKDIAFLPVGRTWQPHRVELDAILRNGGFPPAIDAGAFDLFALTLDPERNPALVGIAAFGRVANIFVRFAGVILELPVSTVVRVQLGIIRATAAALRLLRGGAALAAELDRLGDFLQVGLDSFHNLYEASQGREGNWDPKLIDGLIRTYPTP